MPTIHNNDIKFEIRAFPPRLIELGQEIEAAQRIPHTVNTHAARFFAHKMAEFASGHTDDAREVREIIHLARDLAKGKGEDAVLVFAGAEKNIEGSKFFAAAFAYAIGVVAFFNTRIAQNSRNGIGLHSHNSAGTMIYTQYNKPPEGDNAPPPVEDVFMTAEGLLQGLMLRYPDEYECMLSIMQQPIFYDKSGLDSGLAPIEYEVQLSPLVVLPNNQVVFTPEILGEFLNNVVSVTSEGNEVASRVIDLMRDFSFLEVSAARYAAPTGSIMLWPEKHRSRGRGLEYAADFFHGVLPTAPNVQRSVLQAHIGTVHEKTIGNQKEMEEVYEWAKENKLTKRRWRESMRDTIGQETGLGR